MKYLDLKKQEHAYFFGFAQGDGSMNRPKHCPSHISLTIELSFRDIDILKKFKLLFPFGFMGTRTRNTNFKCNYKSANITSHNKEFCTELELLGIPSGKKSDIISTPLIDYNEIDYWRGLIDADGAIGFNLNGSPFITLVTSSEQIKDAYIKFTESITKKQREVTRNKRDNIYNLVNQKEQAVDIISILYYDGCLSLKRKMKIANKIKKWKRPAKMRKAYELKYWTKEQDDIILKYDEKEAMKMLDRGRSSVHNRKLRLLKNA